MRRYILTLAIAVTCGGCDIYGVRHPGMVLPDPAEKPSATRAYLYGRFAMQPADVDLNGNSMADPMSAAVIIRCKDGNEYTIPFMSNQPVLFEIAPSTCMMSGIVFMNHGKEVGRKEGERAHFRGIMENAEFAPGVAYYLGDFVMGAAVDRSELRQDPDRETIARRDARPPSASGSRTATRARTTRAMPQECGRLSQRLRPNG